MQDLSKSMFSVSLGMSLLGIKTITQMASPNRSTEAFRDTEQYLERINNITRDALGPEMRHVYEYADEMQRRLADASVGVVGANLMDPVNLLRFGQETFETATRMFAIPNLQKD